MVTVHIMVETTGQRIARLRVELARREGKRRVTQQELGDRVGASRGTVAAWEGDKQVPERENLLALAKVFGVSPDFILTGKEASPGPKIIPDPEAPEAGWAGDRTADAIMDVLGRTPEAVRRAEGVVGLDAAAEIGYKLALRIQLPAGEMEKIMAWRRALLDAAESD